MFPTGVGIVPLKMNLTRFVSLFLLLVSVLISQTIETKAAEKSNLQEFGDFARLASPLSAIALTVLMRDPEGFTQFSAGYVSGRLGTYAIKRITDKKRPNYRPGDPKLAFPSGHVEETWQAAAFVRTRYGCNEFTFDCMK